MKKALKILLIGLGSIGQRHAHLLREQACQVMALRMRGAGNALGLPEVFSWEAGYQWRPDVALIANPTALHIETAQYCAEAGYRLFLEKPLGHSTAGLDALLALVEQHRLVSYVAYNLRFDPILTVLRRYLQQYTFQHARIHCTSYLPAWRPTQDHLQSYSAQRALGGGALLDLSHELDYSVYLFGPVLSMHGRLDRRGQVTIDAEDYGDLWLQTPAGPVTIHINFLSHRWERTITMDFAECTVVGNLLTREVIEYRQAQEVQRCQVEGTLATTYNRQWEYFYANIDNPTMMNHFAEAAVLFRHLITLRDTNTCVSY